VAKDSKATEKYGDVVQRLEDVVRRLEGGDLSLEDSLKDFEEGIRLVRRGETLLSDAERRIEQLLADGTTTPLVAAASESSSEAGKRPSEAATEDVPF
jgi:exodeoxyribonuclease VII small subunit